MENIKAIRGIVGVILLLCVLGSCSKLFSSPDYVGEWEVVENDSTHEWVEFTKDKMIANGKEYDIEVKDKEDHSTMIYVKDDNGNTQIALNMVFEDKDSATVYGASNFSDSEVFDIVRK